MTGPSGQAARSPDRIRPAGNFYRVYAIFALSRPIFIVLGLGWSDAADAVGYSSFPASKAQLARCWELVFDRYGSNVLKMEQETSGGNTVVRFDVNMPGDGKWGLVCDGAGGKIVKSERIQGS